MKPVEGIGLFAFDSNALTFFVEAQYSASEQFLGTGALREQRIAAYRLFLFGSPVIVPTVAAEAKAMKPRDVSDRHFRTIAYGMREFIPSAEQNRQIDRRVTELAAHHNGENDCRILAEVEEAGIPVLVTFDSTLRRRLAPHTTVRLLSPADYWTELNIPRGAPSRWVPADSNPLSQQDWWRWE